MSENKSVDLKSLLNTYEFVCELPGSGETLKIKPITTGQLKKILVYEDEKDRNVVEGALDELIKECVVTEGFDIGELYLQDRFYLLLEIRKVTKGSTYNFNFKCPKCSVDNVKSLSLEDVPVVKREFELLDLRINEHVSVQVDFPKRKDQIMAYEYSKSKDFSERELEVEMATSIFAFCMKKVFADGEEVDVNIEDKLYIIDNMNSNILDEMREWFEDKDFGVDFEIEIGCSHCEFKEKQRIPLSDFFV